MERIYSPYYPAFQEVILMRFFPQVDDHAVMKVRLFKSFAKLVLKACQPQAGTYFHNHRFLTCGTIEKKQSACKAELYDR